MKLAFDGVDLQPIANALIARAEADAEDADALMDLATLLFLRDQKAVALDVQAHALSIRRQYTLPARWTPTVRLLTIMTDGDLMANAPLSFLVENSDIELTQLWVPPDGPAPYSLPQADAVFIAVCESSTSNGLLQRLAEASRAWNIPVINAAEGILLTGRTSVYQVLAGVPGLKIPPTALIERDTLTALAAKTCTVNNTLNNLLPSADFPLIVRPLDAHAGIGLEKIDSNDALRPYLDANPAALYTVSPFIDYRSADGLFRKYRVVLIDGVPYAGHMGISAHWMIHYLNAGMRDSVQKRAEEAMFMAEFDTGFAHRHHNALSAIHTRFGLDWLVIDCAETLEGELLVFEVDTGAVVHAMDPVELFPYKPAAMNRVFRAFRRLLLDRR